MKLKKIKHFVIGLLVGVALTISSSSFAGSEKVTAFFSNISIYLNGERVVLKEQPLIHNGTTYLPMRTLVETMGYNVDYEKATNSVYIYQGERKKIETNNIKQETVTPQEKLQKGVKKEVMVDDLFTPYLNKNNKLDLNKIKESVESGNLDVNAKDSKTGETLLIRCVKESNYFVAKYLLAKGADVNLADNEGRTPVHHIVLTNGTPLYLLIVEEYNADIEIKDKYGKRPIDYIDNPYDTMYASLWGEMQSRKADQIAEKYK